VIVSQQDNAFAISYRAARPDERDALEELQRRSSLANEEHRKALLADPGLIFLPQEHVSPRHAIVAESGGFAVGFAIVLRRPDGDAELDGLFVEPPYWRRGIGTELVTLAKRLAVELGVGRLWVIASPAARAFYEKCGFRYVRGVATQLSPALLMNLELTQSGSGAARSLT
jgi:GNAT superfamily N-acetyltransferase